MQQLKLYRPRFAKIQMKIIAEVWTAIRDHKSVSGDIFFLALSIPINHHFLPILGDTKPHWRPENASPLKKASEIAKRLAQRESREALLWSGSVGILGNLAVGKLDKYYYHL